MRTLFFSRSIRLPIDLNEPRGTVYRIISSLKRAGFTLPDHTEDTLVRDFEMGQERLNEAWDSYHPVNLPAARRTLRGVEILPTTFIADPRVRAVFLAVKHSSRISLKVRDRLWPSDLAKLPEDAIAALYTAYVKKDKHVRSWLEVKRKLNWASYRCGVPKSIFKKGWRGHHAPEGIVDR
jgi:hypothetical protein